MEGVEPLFYPKEAKPAEEVSEIGSILAAYLRAALL